MKINTRLLVVGIIGLAVGLALTAFLFVFAGGDTYSVVVMVQDVGPGQVLAPEMVEIQEVSLKDPSAYVLESEVDQFGYKPVVEQLYAGEFLRKSAISYDSNPFADTRIALTLPNGYVAMPIPVTELTIPSSIIVGDHVYITVNIGSATFLTGYFESVPTPVPFDTDAYVPSITYSEDGLDVEGFTFTSPEATPTPYDPIDLPISKTIAYGRVLEIQRERDFNPAASTDPGASIYVAGDIIKIVVAIPVEEMEVIAFAVNSGSVTVSVAAPGDEADQFLFAGFSFDDMVAYYKTAQFFWALTPQPANGEFIPPGASIYAPTMMAPYLPTEMATQEFAPPAGSETATPEPAAPSPTP